MPAIQAKADATIKRKLDVPQHCLQAVEAPVLAALYPAVQHVCLKLLWSECICVSISMHLVL